MVVVDITKNNMTEELEQKIKEGVEKLPKGAQEVMNNFDWVKISEEIGKKNLLDDDEINILQNEIGLILIETNKPDMLTINIENNVGTSKNEAIKISEEVNQKIFRPMFDKMQLIVKNKLKSQTPKWDQSVNFIISGGDYSNFI